jgi:hypothetical protein
MQSGNREVVNFHLHPLKRDKKQMDFAEKSKNPRRKMWVEVKKLGLFQSLVGEIVS